MRSNATSNFSKWGLPNRDHIGVSLSPFPPEAGPSLCSHLCRSRLSRQVCVVSRACMASKGASPRQRLRDPLVAGHYCQPYRTDTQAAASSAKLASESIPTQEAVYLPRVGCDFSQARHFCHCRNPPEAGRSNQKILPPEDGAALGG
jgi:hypothetical protein